MIIFVYKLFDSELRQLEKFVKSKKPGYKPSLIRIKMEIMPQQLLAKSRHGLFRYIILAGLVAGSLDALAAVFILSHGNAPAIFRFISSGIYGNRAFTGGAGMVALGVALHYFIAFSFTIFYFAIFRYLPIFQKNIFLSAIIYGLFIYVMMNVIVFSLCNIHIAHRSIISVVRNSAILVVCVAFPIAYSKQVYNSRN